MTQVAAVGGVVCEELLNNLPGRLHQCLVLLTVQDLKIHDNDLESYIEVKKKQATKSQVCLQDQTCSEK